MAIFRKIVVRNRTFLLAYIFDNDDHQNASQISYMVSNIIEDDNQKYSLIYPISQYHHYSIL